MEHFLQVARPDQIMVAIAALSILLICLVGMAHIAVEHIRTARCGGAYRNRSNRARRYRQSRR